MRPCDDTFGLVRGNRRKAVFAFKGLFTEGICPYSLLGSGLLSRISEVRGKSKLAAHTPIFANKIAGRKSPKPGSGRQVSFFLPHFRVHLSIMCGGLWNLRAQRLFRIKGPQVEASRHFRALGTPGICRILLSFGPCILYFRCCKHLIDAI